MSRNVVVLYTNVDLHLKHDVYPVAFVVRRVTSSVVTLEYVPAVGAYIPDLVIDDMPDRGLAFEVRRDRVLAGEALTQNMIVLALRPGAFSEVYSKYRYRESDGSLRINIQRYPVGATTGYSDYKFYPSSPTSFPPAPAHHIDVYPSDYHKESLSDIINQIKSGNFSQIVITDKTYDHTGRLLAMDSWWKNRIVRVQGSSTDLVLLARIYTPGTLEIRKRRGDKDTPLVVLRNVSNTVFEVQPSESFDPNEHALDVSAMEQWVANLDPFPLPPVPLDAPDDYTRIGYVEFRIPPSQITITTETNMEVSPLLRSAGTHKRMGHAIHKRWAIQVILEGEDINNVMVPLLRQIDRMPFLPIVNDVFNSNGITSIAIDNVMITTVPETPNAVSLTLEGTKFHEEQVLNPLPLIVSINWPLFKLYTDYNPRFFPSRMPWNGQISLFFPTQDYLQKRIQELTESIELPGGERVQRSEVTPILSIIQSASSATSPFELPALIADKPGQYFVAPLPDSKVHYVWVASNREMFVQSLAWAGGGGRNNALVPKVYRIRRGAEGNITVERTPVDDSEIVELLRTAKRQDYKQFLFAVPKDSPLQGVHVGELLSMNLSSLSSNIGLLTRNLERLQKERERREHKYQYFEVDLGNITWQHISVSYQNLISEIDGPEHIGVQQFLGRSDVTAALKGVGDQDAVDRLNRAITLFRDISFLFRGLGLVRDIHVQMRVKNELLNLMGFDSCIPVAVEVNTIPETPNLYEITLQIVSFDPSQFEREYVRRLDKIRDVNVFVRQSTPGFSMDDRVVRVGPISRAYESHGFHRSLQSVETYPDLRLPSFKTVNRWMQMLAEMKDTTIIRSMLEIYSQEDLPYIKTAFDNQLKGIGLLNPRKPKQVLPDTDNYADPDFFICTFGVAGSYSIANALRMARGTDKTHIAVGSDGTQCRISDSEVDIHNVSEQTLMEYMNARLATEAAFRLQNTVSGLQPVTKSKPWSTPDGRGLIAQWEDSEDAMLKLSALSVPGAEAFRPLKVTELSVGSAVLRMGEMLRKQRKLEGEDTGVCRFSLAQGAYGRLFGDAIGQEVLSRLSNPNFLSLLMLSTVSVESGFNTQATSRAGAMGLTQIMPSTWNTLKSSFAITPGKGYALQDITPYNAPTLALAATLIHYTGIMRTLLQIRNSGASGTAPNQRGVSSELSAAAATIWNDDRLLIKYMWGVYNGSRPHALIRYLGTYGTGGMGVYRETLQAFPRLEEAMAKYANSEFIRSMLDVPRTWKEADRSDSMASLTLEQEIQKAAEEARETWYRLHDTPHLVMDDVVSHVERFARNRFKEIRHRINISEADFVFRVKTAVVGEGRIRLPTQSGRGNLSTAASSIEKQVKRLIETGQYNDPGKEPEVRKILHDFVRNPSRPHPLYTSLKERDVLIEYGVALWKNLVEGAQVARANTPDSARTSANTNSPAAKARDAEIEEHGHAIAGKDLTLSGWHDEVKYMPYGRMLVCFPTYCVLLVYGGRWIRFWRFWDQWYGMFGVVSVDVYKNKNLATHVAELNISNMYNSLTNTATDYVLNNALIRSMQWTEYDVVENVFAQGEDQLAQLWRSIRAWLLPRIGDFERRVWETELRSLLIRPGARLHVRLGYGADASRLAPVFNGTINEIRSEDNLLNLVARGDGYELEAPADTSGSGGILRPDGQVESSFAFTGIFGIPIEPRRAITDFFVSIKADSVKLVGPIVYALSMGQYLNANLYGINNFGLTEDLVLGGSGGGLALRVRPGETGVNIYNSTPKGETYSPAWAPFVDFFTLGLSQYFTEGLHASFDIKNVSIWDAINMIRMVVHDYIAAVEPFDLHSTLFVGAPHYPFYYTYRSPREMGLYLTDDNNRRNGVRYSDLMRYKQFQQFHLAVSHLNMIKNGIELSREGLITDCTATDTSDVKGNWIQLDPMIIPEDRRNVTVQSGVNTSSIALLSPFSPEFDPLQWLARFRILRPITEQVGLARPTRVVNNVARNVIREAMMNMYQGQVSLIGNPSIKPHDICIFNDASRLMEGIVGVRDVEHHFSAVHGYITSFSPQLVVTMMSDKEAVRVVHLRALGENLLTNVVLKKRMAYRKAAVIDAVMFRGGMLKTVHEHTTLKSKIAAWKQQLVAGTSPTDVKAKQQLVDDIVDAMTKVGKVDPMDRDALVGSLRNEVEEIFTKGKSRSFDSVKSLDNWLHAALDSVDSALDVEIEVARGGQKIKTKVSRTMETMKGRTFLGQKVSVWLQGFASYTRFYMRKVFDFFVRDMLTNLDQWQPIARVINLNNANSIRAGGKIYSITWGEEFQSVLERAWEFVKNNRGELHKPMKDTLLPILNAIFGLGIRPGEGLLPSVFRFTGRKILFVGSMLDMINRWLSSFYPCMMYPLTVGGKEFSTGIRGHSGTVFGDSPSLPQRLLSIFDPNTSTDRLLGGLWSDGPSSTVFDIVRKVGQILVSRELSAELTNDQIDEILQYRRSRYSDIKIYTDEIDAAYAKARFSTQARVYSGRPVDSQTVQAVLHLASDQNLDVSLRDWLSRVAAHPELVDSSLLEYVRSRYDSRSLRDLVENHRKMYTADTTRIRNILASGRLDPNDQQLFLAEAHALSPFVSPPYDQNLLKFLRVLREKLDGMAPNVRFYVTSSYRPLWYQRLLYLSRHPEASDAGDGLAFTAAEREVARSVFGSSALPVAGASPSSPSPHSRGTAVDLQFYKVVPKNGGGYAMQPISASSGILESPIRSAIEEMRKRGVTIRWGKDFNDPVHFDVR